MLIKGTFEGVLYPVLKNYHYLFTQPHVVLSLRLSVEQKTKLFYRMFMLLFLIQAKPTLTKGIVFSGRAIFLMAAYNAINNNINNNILLVYNNKLNEQLLCIICLVRSMELKFH